MTGCTERVDALFSSSEWPLRTVPQRIAPEEMALNGYQPGNRSMSTVQSIEALMLFGLPGAVVIRALTFAALVAMSTAPVHGEVVITASTTSGHTSMYHSGRTAHNRSRAMSTSIGIRIGAAEIVGTRVAHDVFVTELDERAVEQSITRITAEFERLAASRVTVAAAVGMSFFGRSTCSGFKLRSDYRQQLILCLLCFPPPHGLTLQWPITYRPSYRP